VRQQLLLYWYWWISFVYH